MSPGNSFPCGIVSIIRKELRKYNEGNCLDHETSTSIGGGSSPGF